MHSTYAVLFEPLRPPVRMWAVCIFPHDNRAVYLSCMSRHPGANLRLETKAGGLRVRKTCNSNNPKWFTRSCSDRCCKNALSTPLVRSWYSTWPRCTLQCNQGMATSTLQLAASPCRGSVHPRRASSGTRATLDEAPDEAPGASGDGAVRILKTPVETRNVQLFQHHVPRPVQSFRLDAHQIGFQSGQKQWIIFAVAQMGTKGPLEHLCLNNVTMASHHAVSSRPLNVKSCLAAGIQRPSGLRRDMARDLPPPRTASGACPSWRCGPQPSPCPSSWPRAPPISNSC